MGMQLKELNSGVSGFVLFSGVSEESSAFLPLLAG